MVGVQPDHHDLVLDKGFDKKQINLAEIFSDEIKANCPKCKNLIYRGRLPSCLDWCKAARDCIGEERWIKLKGGA